MPVYAYKGLNQAGRNVNGIIDADTSKSARAKLRQDGIFPTELGEADENAQAGHLVSQS